MIDRGDADRSPGAVALPSRGRAAPDDGRDLLLGIRPEHIRIVPAEGAPLAAAVDLVEPTGPEDIITLKVAGQPSILRRPAGEVAQGGTVGIAVGGGKAMLCRDGPKGVSLTNAAQVSRRSGVPASVAWMCSARAAH